MKIFKVIANHKIVSAVIAIGIIGSLSGSYVVYTTSQPLKEVRQTSSVAPQKDESKSQAPVEKEAIIKEAADKPIPDVAPQVVQEEKTTEKIAEEPTVKSTKGTWVFTQFDEIGNTCYASRIVYITASEQQWQDLFDSYTAGAKETISDTLVNKNTNEVLCISKI